MNKLFKKENLTLYIPLLIILLISLFNMLNSRMISSTYDNYFYRQLLWIIIGIITLIVSTLVNKKIINKLIIPSYIITIILLGLVLIYGKTINGSKAWFKILNFSIQPSEIMKLTLPLMLFKYEFKHDWTYFLYSSVLTIVPTILVFLEPDTAACIFYFLIYISALIYQLKSKLFKIILIIILTGLIISGIYLVFFNQEFLIKIFGSSIYYRLDRIITFTSNYQIENALIVIGSAAPLKLKLYDISLYIPASVTDFILAFTIGNFGYLIGFLVMICYLIIILFILKKSLNKKNYLSFPIFYIFSFQVIYNIAMNFNIVPIMGIPLPFLSYGGSNIIIYFILFGLLLNMDDNNSYNHRNNQDYN